MTKPKSNQSNAAPPGVITAELHKSDLLDLLQVFGGGVRGKLKTIRPDDRFPMPAIVGPASSGIIPYFYPQRVVTGREKRVAERLHRGSDTHDEPEKQMTERQYIEDAPVDRLEVEPFLRRMRATIGGTVYECANPKAGESEEIIQTRLAKAIRLRVFHESIENLAYDFGLHGRDSCIADLFEHATRDQRDFHRDGPLRRFVERLRTELRAARDLEYDLRGYLEDRLCNDYDHEPSFDRQLVGAIFDAALRLEASFETRVFEGHSELRSS